MFTGIVEETGPIESVTPTATGIRLVIAAKLVAQDLKLGDSLAINGCCLTLVKRSRKGAKTLLGFDLLKETWLRTNLQFLKPGADVNLERALAAGGRFGGHFVSGHVDGVGRISKWERSGADHVLDVETLGATFFKEVKLPISRVNGKFGFQYVSITQDMQAILTDAGANPTGSLRARSDMRAYGPQLKLEYFRPVGHTKMEFLTSFGTSVLFGKRDQFVANSANGNLSRIGADEFLTIFDFFAGAQYRKMTAENRCWFARGGFTTQSWLNGGTAILPQDDFGLRGLTFSVGVNR